MFLKSIFVFCLAVATVQCFPGKSIKTHSEADKEQRLGVYGGFPAKIEDHPYRVVINLSNQTWCQGIIVGDSWVLTDPVSVLRVDPRDLEILAGSQDAENGTKYEVNKIVIHPKAGDQIMDKEWALLKIEGKFKLNKKVQIVTLPTSDAKVNTNMTIAGWGDTHDSDGQRLMAGYMTWTNPKDCAPYYGSTIPKWTKSMSCAFNKGKTTPCYYDFGLGLVNNGVLYGTFIAGVNYQFCSKNAGPVIVANVHAGLPWIKSVISK